MENKAIAIDMAIKALRSAQKHVGYLARPNNDQATRRLAERVLSAIDMAIADLANDAACMADDRQQRLL